MFFDKSVSCEVLLDSSWNSEGIGTKNMRFLKKSYFDPKSLLYRRLGYKRKEIDVDFNSRFAFVSGI